MAKKKQETKVFSGARAVFKFEGEPFNFGPLPLHWADAQLDEMGKHFGIRRSMGENDASLRKRVMASLQRPQPMSMPTTQGIFKNEFDGLTDSQFLESEEYKVKIVYSEPPSCSPTHDWWSTTPPETPPETPPDPRPATYTNAQGCKVRCPWCDSGSVEAEFVDVGVGHQQVTGHLCHTCGASEIYPGTKEEDVNSTEWKLGWHKPNDQYFPPENCAEDGCMETHICATCKPRLWGEPPV